MVSGSNHNLDWRLVAGSNTLLLYIFHRQETLTHFFGILNAFFSKISRKHLPVLNAETKRGINFLFKQSFWKITGIG